MKFEKFIELAEVFSEDNEGMYTYSDEYCINDVLKHIEATTGVECGKCEKVAAYDDAAEDDGEGDGRCCWHVIKVANLGFCFKFSWVNNSWDSNDYDEMPFEVKAVRKMVTVYE